LVPALHPGDIQFVVVGDITKKVIKNKN